VIVPQPDDDRFAHPAWRERPYDLLAQAVLLGEEWWDGVVRSPGGVSGPNERMVAFCMRQWLDLMSPSNVPWLKPGGDRGHPHERRRQPRAGIA
jgi:polyhydroxyalkanoate synthase